MLARILSDATAMLEEQDDLATLEYRFAGLPDSPPVRMRAELAVSGFMRVVRKFCCEATMPREALFQHAAPPHRAEYTRLFGGAERFEQPVTALRFDRALLDRRSPHGNPRLKQLFTREADRIVDQLERTTTCAERVREWLAAQGADDVPTMSAAAEGLGTSVRSLRRTLAQEAASFPKLLRQARITAAKRLLDDDRRSIYQVAFELGFSDPSAFHRAFRRWTGMTPMQYRASS